MLSILFRSLDSIKKENSVNVFSFQAKFWLYQNGRWGENNKGLIADMKWDLPVTSAIPLHSCHFAGCRALFEKHHALDSHIVKQYKVSSCRSIPTFQSKATSTRNACYKRIIPRTVGGYDSTLAIDQIKSMLFRQEKDCHPSEDPI